MSKIDIDVSTLKKLANLLNKENLAEIELGQGEDFIRITRTVAGTMVASAPSQAPITQAVAAQSAPEPVKPAHDDAVESPIVGTAYLSPSPGADAFVSVGSQVKKGDTIIIIEAMKVMNPIVAPQDGTVTEILVSDSQPVEFGQPLIVIT